MSINNIMLDLETMGNTPNAAIIAIGAVRFDGVVNDTFYCTIDLSDSVKNGLTMDPDTVMWWMQQSNDARGAFKNPEYDLAAALDAFETWVGDTPAVVWGNGSDFDNAILANAYARVGRAAPWKFGNNRCYRTMKNLFPNIHMERTGTYHNALDDARSQANHLIRILARMGK